MAPLPHDDVLRIVKIFELHGAHAKISSIHVNGWFGDYDKLTTSRPLMMSELFGVGSREAARDRYVLFPGDSPQRRADVRLLPQRAWAWPMCATSPPTWTTCHRWITHGALPGAGFVELAKRPDRARVG